MRLTTLCGVNRHESPESITQATPVGRIARLLRGTDPVTVRPDDSLRQVAEASVAHPECGVLLVVDEAGVLVGLIPATRLVRDIFARIVPEEVLSHIGDVEAALEYAALLGARTAADVMDPPVAVQADDTAREAFRRLRESGLAGLPVIDSRGHVEAYLDELELLLAWVEATGRSRLLEPTDDETDGPTDEETGR
jgi:CBS domain-containing protein